MLHVVVDGILHKNTQFTISGHYQHVLVELLKQLQILDLGITEELDALLLDFLSLVGDGGGVGHQRTIICGQDHLGLALFKIEILNSLIVYLFSIYLSSDLTDRSFSG